MGSLSDRMQQVHQEKAIRKREVEKERRKGNVVDYKKDVFLK